MTAETYSQRFAAIVTEDLGRSGRHNCGRPNMTVESLERLIRFAVSAADAIALKEIAGGSDDASSEGGIAAMNNYLLLFGENRGTITTDSFDFGGARLFQAKHYQANGFPHTARAIESLIAMAGNISQLEPCYWYGETEKIVQIADDIEAYKARVPLSERIGEGIGGALRSVGEGLAAIATGASSFLSDLVGGIFQGALGTVGLIIIGAGTGFVVIKYLGFI